MDWLLKAPLLTPWMGTVTAVVAALVVLGLWWWRTRLRRWYTQLVVVLLGVAAMLGCWYGIDVVWRPIADGIGWIVWRWIGVLVLVLGQVVVGPWRRQTPRRRVLPWLLGGVAGFLVVLLACLLSVNAYFATYRDLASVLGTDVKIVSWQDAHPAPVAHPTVVPLSKGPVSAGWKAPADMPKTGTVVQSHIPASDPKFKPRPTLIYLPPAYETAHRPELPVMVLLGGQPGNPRDWATAGEAVATLDDFAARHNGLAPIVVFADHIAVTWQNPLCSDAQLGNVATYLQKDLPAWLEKHLQVDAHHRPWAIGGISNGGTCALQVVTRDPQRYPVLLDMSGEPHPTLGDPQRTLQQGFGGDVALMEANDPLTLMKKHRYPGVSAIFSSGLEDRKLGSAAPEVGAAAKRAGMDVQVRRYEGSHTWSLWSEAFQDQLPWAAQKMGLVK